MAGSVTVNGKISSAGRIDKQEPEATVPAMSAALLEKPLPDAVPAQAAVYPDSDGMPMADNTKQFDWIVTLKSGFDALFQDDPNVFVAGDLLWYPVEGNPKIRAAPDVLIAIGRPKGHRGSYMQWKEDNAAPQLVMEVLSPGNTLVEMTKKWVFYQQYGVNEFYIYDPDNGAFSGYVRVGGQFEPIPDISGWKSPLTGVTFQVDGEGNLVCTRPDGGCFESFEQLTRRANAERTRADRLAEKLRALGVEDL